MPINVKNPSFWSLVILGFYSLVIPGCALTDWVHNKFQVGPNYAPPIVSVADQWIDLGSNHVVPIPAENDHWWSVFQDPVIEELIRVAYNENLTLRQAALRIEQARAIRAITAGNLAPQVQQAFGTLTQIQQSQSVAVPSPVRAFGEWEAGFNASWELDVWGKIRRSIESADADVDVAIADYDTILVSLIAEVITAYMEIRIFEQRIEYAKQNVSVQESSLDLSTDRFEEGKTSKLGVTLADANLNATKATIPALEIGLRQSSNRLCVLLGLPPGDLISLIGEDRGIPKVPAEVVLGIPADLLRRRPDIRQAERAVASQSAQIGVAVAELYPSFSINGEIFQASEDVGDLLNSASSAGSIGPAFRWNILNYGRLKNNIRLQDALFQELVSNLENTALEANREVEDALVAFIKSQETVLSLQANVDNLDESLDLLLINFEEGSINFSPVFVLQESLRVAQDQLAAAQGDVVLSLIELYRALGGGWQIRMHQGHHIPIEIPALESGLKSEEIPIPPQPAADVMGHNAVSVHPEYGD